MENSKETANIAEPTIDHLVPSKKAYVVAFLALLASGILGGMIGFACMRVFFPNQGAAVEGIGTCIITGLIIYGMSIITSLGLQASVEWKSRQNNTPNSKRPSRMVKDPTL